MEIRKQKEIDYYDREAQKSLGVKEAGNTADFNPFLLESYAFLRNYLQEGYNNKTVLDYGCGTGLHLPWLSRSFSKVVGIDISQKSLAKAAERVKTKNNVQLILRDCEKMEFADNSFDVIFDGGAFSSLNLDNALQEIHRVLKHGGMLIGIETLGHNPLTNFKRKINTIVGMRTVWAADHIFKTQDLNSVEKYFTIVKLKYFHLTSWIAFPFLNLPGGKWFLKMLEKFDHLLLAGFPFLKKYSFKIVFVLVKK